MVEDHITGESLEKVKLQEDAAAASSTTLPGATVDSVATG